MSVLLACGDRAMAEHVGAHDGLPERHPSCVVHMGEPGGLNCKVVPIPDLTGRLAMCHSYGRGEKHNAGPIYPDDKTDNNGMCAGKTCFCLVPSDMDLPFFSYERPAYDERCAVRWEGPAPAPGYDARGYCTYGESAHDPARGRGLVTPLKIITVRYPKARCGQCGIAIPIHAVAEWGRDKNGRGAVYHFIDMCPPLTHKFVKRTDLGQDSFYCGCGGWD